MEIRRTQERSESLLTVESFADRPRQGCGKRIFANLAYQHRFGTAVKYDQPSIEQG